jgi:hypothetical protein
MDAIIAFAPESGYRLTLRLAQGEENKLPHAELVEA